MKVALFALLFATSAFAQAPPAAVPPACGPGNVDFKVKLDDSQHAPAQPTPDKALVYFIHDAGMWYPARTTVRITALSVAYPTLKLGMDGAWVGANHGDSWFSVSVEPGEHHVCVTLQSSFVDQRVELARFTAEPGKVYYYRTRLVMSGTVELLELDPIDSDQGRYLISYYPLSISAPKKPKK